MKVLAKNGKSYEPFVKKDRTDIIGEILKVAEKGIKKTHFMYKVGLSFRQLEIYLRLLERKKLLEYSAPEDNNGRNNDYGIYKTTEKGLAIRKIIENMGNFFR